MKELVGMLLAAGGLQNDPMADDGIVQYQGDTLILDTDAMKVGERYEVTRRGAPGVVVKDDDGSISFYRTLPLRLGTYI